MGLSTVPFPINTARIPEFPHFSVYGAMSLADRFVFTMNGYDKTVHGQLLDLQQLLVAGGSSAFAPVVNGDQIIHDVTNAEAGGYIVSIPTLAGKTFKLSRSGFPLKQGTDYEILNAGGFEMLGTDNTLTEGERFSLELYQLQATGSTPGSTPGAGAGAFLAGIKPITTNTTLDTADVNKVLQLRADSTTQLTLTLPAVTGVPQNSFTVIEAVINSVKQHKINVQSGQKIYMNSASYDQIYIGAGEVVWLYRGDDGWYVFNEFGQIYSALGRPYASYKVGPGEIAFNGGLLNRADCPRIWEEVQSYGSSLVTDTQWLSSTTINGVTVYPYQGCWSTGDGVGTFRVPNLTGMALRGVSTIDLLRTYNHPGGYMHDYVGPHTHDIAYGNNGTDGTANGQTIRKSSSDNSEGNGTGLNSYAVQQNTGTETTMRNIGVLWVAKY